jgi:hypothetical protein
MSAPGTGFSSRPVDDLAPITAIGVPGNPPILSPVATIRRRPARGVCLAAVEDLRVTLAGSSL